MDFLPIDQKNENFSNFVFYGIYFFHSLHAIHILIFLICLSEFDWSELATSLSKKTYNKFKYWVSLNKTLKI
jgi:hypothetical protein